MLQCYFLARLGRRGELLPIAAVATPRRFAKGLRGQVGGCGSSEPDQPQRNRNAVWVAGFRAFAGPTAAQGSERSMPVT